MDHQGRRKYPSTFNEISNKVMYPDLLTMHNNHGQNETENHSNHRKKSAGDYDLPQLKMYQRELSQLNANTRNTTTHTSLPCKYAHTNTKIIMCELRVKEWLRNQHSAWQKSSLHYTPQILPLWIRQTKVP